MQLFTLAFTTLLALAAAAPGPATKARELENRSDCGHATCGTCNGFSCWVVGANYDCDFGKCGSGAGAPDGSPCGFDTWHGSGTDVYCPGH